MSCPRHGTRQSQYTQTVPAARSLPASFQWHHTSSAQAQIPSVGPTLWAKHSLVSGRCSAQQLLWLCGCGRSVINSSLAPAQTVAAMRMMQIPQSSMLRPTSLAGKTKCGGLSMRPGPSPSAARVRSIAASEPAVWCRRDTSTRQVSWHFITTGSAGHTSAARQMPWVRLATRQCTHACDRLCRIAATDTSLLQGEDPALENFGFGAETLPPTVAASLNGLSYRWVSHLSCI